MPEAIIVKGPTLVGNEDPMALRPPDATSKLAYSRMMQLEREKEQTRREPGGVFLILRPFQERVELVRPHGVSGLADRMGTE